MMARDMCEDIVLYIFSKDWEKLADPNIIFREES